MMPRNELTKEEIKVRIYKLKSSLYDGQEQSQSADWHDGAHNMLNRVLDILDEYRF